MIEKTVLASAIFNKEALSDMIKIGPECFTGINKRTYNVIQELYLNNEPIDLTILNDKIDTSLLAELAQIPPTVNIKYHLNKLVEAKNKRKLDDICTFIKDYYKTKDFEEMKVEIFNKLLAIDDTSKIYNNKDLFNMTTEDLIHKTTIMSGFTDLDDMLTGFYKGQLTIIGSRSGVGKSAFALQLAKNMCRFNNVLFVSLEMPVKELMWRFIANECEISINDLRTGNFGVKKKAEIDNIIKTFKSVYSGLNFSDKVFDLTRLISCIRDFADRKKDCIIFVDYLQLINVGKDIQRYLQIGEITRALKFLALGMDISIVALSQLGRQAEYRENPRLADLRESGNIEQDSDVVLLMHEDQESHFDNVMEVIIAKNRNGNKGKIELFFNKKFMKFNSVFK